jgi:hypothetical protein
MHFADGHSAKLAAPQTRAAAARPKLTLIVTNTSVRRFSRPRATAPLRLQTPHYLLHDSYKSRSRLNDA